jgi:hypothetical protein
MAVPDIIDAHDIWEIFQDLYDMPKCEDQDQRASMQSEAIAANNSSSCAHDDILAKDDERRETKSQNEDLGFEHNKSSTSEDHVASVSLEEWSTSEAHTDPLVASLVDQLVKKSKLGDPVEKRSNWFPKPV